MTSHFTSEFFAGNRRALREKLHSDVPIVVAANGLLQRGADSSYGFSQDANFWYLTGIDEPDVTLVMTIDEEFLMVAAREAMRETFDGAVDSGALTERSGIERVVDETAGWRHLDGILDTAGKAAVPAAAPSYLQQYGMYANPARARVADRIQKHVGDIELIDIRKELAQLRMLKQPAELTALQAAIDMTSETLNDVLKTGNLKQYKHEYELEADIARGFRFRGAAGHGFEPIVAGGARACTLHNISNEAPFNKSDLVVCDVGAEVEHYSADITRTVALGTPSQRQRDIYDAVQAAQTYALGLLKPGVLLKDYEAKVARFVAKELVKLKLAAKAEADDQVRDFFPHATSHFLGLNVHDAGDYTQPLMPGMVITCEPGIYVQAEGIGVRIEDDVLITDTGNTVLSAACKGSL